MKYCFYYFDINYYYSVNVYYKFKIFETIVQTMINYKWPFIYVKHNIQFNYSWFEMDDSPRGQLFWHLLRIVLGHLLHLCKLYLQYNFYYSHTIPSCPYADILILCSIVIQFISGMITTATFTFMMKLSRQADNSRTQVSISSYRW